MTSVVSDATLKYFIFNRPSFTEKNECFEILNEVLFNKANYFVNKSCLCQKRDFSGQTKHKQRERPASDGRRQKWIIYYELFEKNIYMCFGAISCMTKFWKLSLKSSHKLLVIHRK